ncbi:thymidine kinase [bacterium]|jgi:thymidine kinase|nr:thymidine kinase [bacterium]
MTQNSSFSKGSLEIICGSMFSGKTDELIRRVDRARIAKQNVTVFKHKIDKRVHDTENFLTSRTGSKIEAIAVKTPEEILDYVKKHNIQVVGIDEAHFFSPYLVDVVAELIIQKKRIIIDGLELDFRGRPFAWVATLMAMADKVIKLNAICSECNDDTFCLSQRIIDGKPAKYDDPIILVGSEEYYIPRCRGCYQIDKKPDFTNQK